MLLNHAGWLGTIPGWLTLVALLLLGWAVRGGQIGPALGYLREANETLRQENNALKDQVAENTKEITTLRSTHDLEPVIQRIVMALDAHEKASAKRDDGVLLVLERIADSLPANHVD